MFGWFRAFYKSVTAARYIVLEALCFSTTMKPLRGMRYTGFKNVSKTINCCSISKRINCIFHTLVIARRALIIVEKRITKRFQKPCRGFTWSFDTLVFFV